MLSLYFKGDDISRISKPCKIVERMVNQNTYDDIAQGICYYFYYFFYFVSSQFIGTNKQTGLKRQASACKRKKQSLPPYFPSAFFCNSTVAFPFARPD